MLRTGKWKGNEILKIQPRGPVYRVGRKSLSYVGFGISPLHQQAESRNLGQTFLGNSVLPSCESRRYQIQNAPSRARAFPLPMTEIERDLQLRCYCICASLSLVLATDSDQWQTRTAIWHENQWPVGCRRPTTNDRRFFLLYHFSYNVTDVFTLCKIVSMARDQRRSVVA